MTPKQGTWGRTTFLSAVVDNLSIQLLSIRDSRKERGKKRAKKEEEEEEERRPTSDERNEVPNASSYIVLAHSGGAPKRVWVRPRLSERSFPAGSLDRCRRCHCFNGRSCCLLLAPRWPSKLPLKQPGPFFQLSHSIIFPRDYRRYYIDAVSARQHTRCEVPGGRVSQNHPSFLITVTLKERALPIF